MSGLHVVRVGALGHVGRLAAVEAVHYPRGSRVVVRTPRGLEIGEVLCPPEPTAAPAESDGQILRGMTVSDELLAARLEQNRHEAFDACSRKLSEQRLPATLMEVEHLFDGQTLVFYFLGEQTPEIDRLTSELAEAYDAEAQLRRFAETLSAGCGPGCGTDEAARHGCTSCAVGCAVSGACGTTGERKAAR